jgi:ubiquinone/menaquinone biosynthesis C-methylase UbiE
MMVQEATRRNRRWIDNAMVEIVQTEAGDLPWPDATFDGAVAVNSIQLWEPWEPAVAEVARVVKPGGRLSHLLTHETVPPNELSTQIPPDRNAPRSPKSTHSSQ